MTKYEDLMGAKEVSEFLGIGYNAAYELMHQDGFPLAPLPGSKSYRVTKSNLIRYINETIRRN